MGEIDPEYAADIRAILDDPQLQLYRFELAVRGIAGAERQAEMNRTLKSYVTSSSVNFSSLPSLPRFPGASPSLSAGYDGRSVHTIVIDEVTQIK